MVKRGSAMSAAVERVDAGAPGQRPEERAPGQREWLRRLRLQSAHVFDQRRDLIVRQTFDRLHPRLSVVVFQPLFHGLEGLIVRKPGLHFGVGEIADVQLLSHLGVTLAVRAVTFGAIVIPVGLRVGGPGGHRRTANTHERNCQYSFHRRDFSPWFEDWRGGSSGPSPVCGGDYRTGAVTALPQSWLMFRINWRADGHLLAVPPWAGRANRPPPPGESRRRGWRLTCPECRRYGSRCRGGRDPDRRQDA